LKRTSFLYRFQYNLYLWVRVKGFSRIALVTRYPPVHCGVAEYSRMLLKALRSLMPTVELFVLSTDEASSSEYVDPLTKTRVVPLYGYRDTSYYAIPSFLEEIGGVDIVHLQHEYGIYGYSVSILSALEEVWEKKLAKAIVVTLHTVHHPYSGRPGALEFQSALNNSFIDAVIVHSKLQEFELQMQGVNPSRIIRIPHGTLINPYLGLSRIKLAEELGLDLASFRGMILSIPGFMRPDKGFDILLEAVGGLKSLTILVAGEVKDPRLKELLEDSPNTVVLDQYLSKSKMLKLIALSDAVVLPYRDRPGAYAVSGVLHLAMGSFKPIIGTRVPRLIELYDNAPQMTITPGNSVELRKKLVWLLENYEHAMMYMEKMYSYAVGTEWHTVARKHLQLYVKLAKKQQ